MRQVFRNEQRYYELLVDKSATCLCLFPYHLADIITKGLRVTPFNYYVDVLSYLLKNDRSYDTLPNFTAADCTYKSINNRIFDIFVYSFSSTGFADEQRNLSIDWPEANHIYLGLKAYFCLIF